jgi:anti-sigma regulatory factor (Ser/Thr protein kinase)
MTARESGPGVLSCTLRGSEAVTEGSTAARTFGEAEWLSEDELARLCIIIEELLANLYDHGGVSAEHDVELNLASEPGGIRITLFDPGTRFDPRSAPRPPEEPERGGGAGIDIVRAWAEFVDYRATDAGNRLELLFPVRT